MQTPQTTPGFDERAQSWDDDPMKVERANAVADAIARAVPLDRSMRALDFGCGTGLLSFALRARIGEITLADVSEGMLSVLATKIAAAGDARMHPLKLDLLADPLPDARYDLVYSLMTLHHVPDTEGILRKFRALLPAPGRLCIADLDREDGSFHGAGFDGHLGFDREDLAAKARRAGFAQVRFSTAYVVRKASGGAMREYPLFLMVAA